MDETNIPHPENLNDQQLNAERITKQRNMEAASRPWVIALTGASGICYARSLISALVNNVPNIQLDIVVSDSALRVMQEEEGIKVSSSRLNLNELLQSETSLLSTQRVSFHNNRNVASSIASGSYLTQGMVIIPCSMKTLAAISNGYCENVIQRAADVTLKEKRRLVIVPRETPLSAIHLENMLKLSRLDVRVVAAMPGFYQQPQTIAELVDALSMRVLDQMGFDIALSQRWQTPEQELKLISNVVPYETKQQGAKK